MATETDSSTDATPDVTPSEAKVEAKAEGTAPAAAPADVKVSDPALRPRDVPVSTVIRLMGLPTAADLTVIESKIDILSTKVSTVAARVERIATQLMEVFHDFDRFDVQIADMREFMKQSLTSVVGKMDSMKESSPQAANGAGDTTPKAG